MSVPFAEVSNLESSTIKKEDEGEEGATFQDIYIYIYENVKGTLVAVFI